MGSGDQGESAESAPADQQGVARIVSLIESGASVLNNLIRFGFAFLIVRELYKIVTVLAGENTFADIGISIEVLGEAPVSHGIAWALAALGVGYGLRQAKLRRDTVERLQGRIQSLETELDPNRTTSGITPRGTTRPEDRI